MPNFTVNNVRITGPADDVADLKEFMVTEVTDFDFAQVIPIPELRKDRSLDPYLELVLEEDEELRREACSLADDADQVRKGFVDDFGLGPKEVLDLRGQTEDEFWQYTRDFAGMLNRKAEEQRKSGATPPDRDSFGRGRSAFRDLERQGIIPLDNEADAADLVWGARGPLGYEPIETLVSHTNKSGQGKLRYRLTTAWTAPLLAYEAVSERYPSVRLTVIFNHENSDRIGIYTFSSGKRVCEFDASCFEDGFMDAVERVDGKQLLQHLGVPAKAKKKPAGR